MSGVRRAPRPAVKRDVLFGDAKLIKNRGMKRFAAAWSLRHAPNLVKSTIYKALPIFLTDIFTSVRRFFVPWEAHSAPRRTPCAAAFQHQPTVCKN
ncbi:MAG: hypothetical protein ACI4TQ_01785 [Alloprevotella sp.]